MHYYVPRSLRSYTHPQTQSPPDKMDHDHDIPRCHIDVSRVLSSLGKRDVDTVAWFEPESTYLRKVKRTPVELLRSRRRSFHRLGVHSTAGGIASAKKSVPGIDVRQYHNFLA
jgi:hypothetical protein